MNSERRISDRDPCRIKAAIRLQHGAAYVACVIEDISERGAKLRFADDIKLTPTFVLSVPVLQGCFEDRLVEVRWQVGTAVGVSFCPAASTVREANPLSTHPTATATSGPR